MELTRDYVEELSKNNHPLGESELRALCDLALRGLDQGVAVATGANIRCDKCGTKMHVEIQHGRPQADPKLADECRKAAEGGLRNGVDYCGLLLKAAAALGGGK